MLLFFPQEQFYGNLEYKLYIGLKKNDRILSQFLFRLREGNGKANYIIGITDEGFLHITNIKLIIQSIFNFIYVVTICVYFSLNFSTKSTGKLSFGNLILDFFGKTSIFSYSSIFFALLNL